MTTGQQITGYNYQDYVPTEGILCPICEITCNTLQNLNRVSTVHNNTYFCINLLILAFGY